jgi:hypothetical protein
VPIATVLRALVIAEAALLTGSVLTVFLPDETTPAVDEHLEGPGAGPLVRLIDAEPTALTYILGAVLVLFVAVYVASLVGLLCLKRWARRLYAISFIAGVCLYPFMGHSLTDPISGTIDFLAAACSGAILAVVFLTDAKTHFNGRTPNTSLERTRD